MQELSIKTNEAKIIELIKGNLPIDADVNYYPVVASVGGEKRLANGFITNSTRSTLPLLSICTDINLGFVEVGSLRLSQSIVSAMNNYIRGHIIALQTYDHTGQISNEGIIHLHGRAETSRSVANIEQGNNNELVSKEWVLSKLQAFATLNGLQMPP